MAASDAPQVLRVNASGRPGVARLDDAELARLLSLPNEHLVATDEGAAFAYALAFHRAAPYDGEEFRVLRSALTQPFIYIDQVAVAAGSRGRGMGRALYAELERIAYQHKIRVLCCEVNSRPANPASLAFHQRMGFEFLASLAVSDGREVELLTRTLPESAGA
jgi:predicted GNAT superfamily acetyltransferase